MASPPNVGLLARPEIPRDGIPPGIRTGSRYRPWVPSGSTGNAILNLAACKLRQRCLAGPLRTDSPPLRQAERPLEALPQRKEGAARLPPISSVSARWGPVRSRRLLVVDVHQLVVVVPAVATHEGVAGSAQGPEAVVAPEAVVENAHVGGVPIVGQGRVGIVLVLDEDRVVAAVDPVVLDQDVVDRAIARLDDPASVLLVGRTDVDR